jgi:voltage-gated potassium channel Kch
MGTGTPPRSNVLRGHKYAVLLVMLIAALAIQSLGAEPGRLGLLADAVVSLLVVAIFLVVFERPRERAVMAVVVVGTLGTAWAHHAATTRLYFELSLAQNSLMALFMSVAVWVILRELFRSRVVGAENVRGAICGYLIAGAAWSSVNTLAYLLVPSSYNINPQISALLDDWHGRTAVFAYYSYAQMLTIGYPDVAPVRAPATTTSLLSTLFGLFYTAVVVSQLVGMAQSRRPDAKHGDER